MKNAIHVGHSTGGGEVARYIGRHGTKRVAKAVLIGAVPPVMLKSAANPGGTPMEAFDQIRAAVVADRSQFWKDLSMPFYGFNKPGARVSEGLRESFWLQGQMCGFPAAYFCVKAFSETDMTEDLKKMDGLNLLATKRRMSSGGGKAMIGIRKAEERGHTRLGWLDSRHTFSFGDYHDDEHMGFRALRVLNDDRVQPGQGFGTHGHRDMEILSYVLEGALEHKDSSGGGGVIRPGEIQFMRAGSGVTHSEYNHSKTEPVHFLQVWIVPDKRGLKPTYGQQVFDRDGARRSFVLLASADGREKSIQVEQDASVWMTLLGKGESRELALGPQRHAWIHVARGAASLNGTPLQEGDGAGTSGEETLNFIGGDAAEILVFDLK